MWPFTSAGRLRQQGRTFLGYIDWSSGTDTYIHCIHEMPIGLPIFFFYLFSLSFLSCLFVQNVFVFVFLLYIAYSLLDAYFIRLLWLAKQFKNDSAIVLTECEQCNTLPILERMPVVNGRHGIGEVLTMLILSYSS